MAPGAREAAVTGEAGDDAAATVPPRRRVLAALRRFARGVMPRGLSARLLVLTIFFVLASEVFIYVPTIASHRLTLFTQRLEAAQLAALVLEANDKREVATDLSEELLANAGVLSVVLKRNDQRSLFLKPGEVPPQPERRFDIAQEGGLNSVYEAFGLLLRTRDRIISIRGVPRLEGGLLIEAVLEEQPIRAAMIAYSENIFLLSIVISLTTAFLVFGAIHLLLVQPIKRIERSMAEFRRNPQDPRATMVAGRRRDEIGMAERELAQMQQDLRAALHQRARLAALGTAVSKINHDLRNMLSSAQLIADRLEGSEDPQVRRLAPKLVSAIDRAVALASNTLRYGRAEEAAPRPRAVDLRRLVDDVGASAIAHADGPVRWTNGVSAGFELFADSDQLFRVLLNLAGNAVQAIEHGRGAGEVSVRAAATEGDVVIEVRDDGPGVPEAARARLFEPFASVSRNDGSGLGLAIAAELVKAHGGTIALAATGADGTVFRIRLPQPG
jgi:signal transduction histidine kinase